MEMGQLHNAIHQRKMKATKKRNKLNEEASALLHTGTATSKANMYITLLIIHTDVSDRRAFTQENTLLYYTKKLLQNPPGARTLWRFETNLKATQ